MTTFWVKNIIFLSVLAEKISFPVFKKIIYNFMNLCGWARQKKIFPPSFFGAVVGSGINISGPQH
jgi:hypothetical protein